MAGSSFQELLQNLAQQVESMSMTVAAAVKASRKESDDLVKKNKALQAALLAKSSEGDVAAASEVSVEPGSFADHLASDTLKLVVFNRELYVHRSVLSSIPFFEAKMEHWGDEPVKLPEEVTELAFDNLLMRLYVGASLPAGSVALRVQIIHLAKYWLLDVVVTEMVAEVLQMAKKENIPVLDELAKRFGIDELFLALEKPQTEPLCSSKELQGFVELALGTGDARTQVLCTALLKEHPQARHVVREQLAHCVFNVCYAEARVSRTLHVESLPGFPWFWQELKGVGLLQTDLPFISGMIMSKLNEAGVWGVNISDHRFLVDLIGDMMDSAADRLRAGSLRPADLQDLLALKPSHWLHHPSVDFKMANLITDLPLATARKVVQMMMGRILEVGPATAAALHQFLPGHT